MGVRYRIFLILLVPVTLTSCTDFLYANLFSQIDSPEPLKIDVASLGSGDAQADVSRIAQALEQKDFLKNLSSAGSSEDKSAILTFLSEQYGATPSDENRQTLQSAALIAAEISLKTTVAEKAVNNAVDMLLEVGNSDDSDGDIDEEELISLLIPAEAQPPGGSIEGDLAFEDAKVNFVEMVVAMREANKAYEAFGASLEDSDSDGDKDYTGGENMGVVTQAAVITAVVDTVVDDLIVNKGINSGAEETDTEQAAERMYDILFGDDISELWSDADSNPLESTLENNSALDSILSASPFDDLFEGFTSEGGS